MRKTSDGAVAYTGFSQKEFAASSGGGINESGGSDGKESACNAGDLDSIPGLGRSAEGGHGNPFQYSCLEDPHGQREPGGLQSMGSQRVRHN